eukprot:7361137-Prymnesium_polylepis.1
MAMAKMAGDADRESGCDEGARAASSVHLAARRGGGGERPSRWTEWPTRGAKGNEILVNDAIARCGTEFPKPTAR